MKFKTTLLAITIISTLIAGGCHAQKSAGTKATVGKSVAVPPSSARQADTTVRTPSPKITPVITPNTRPKPVPEPQPPVPPM